MMFMFNQVVISIRVKLENYMITAHKLGIDEDCAKQVLTEEVDRSTEHPYGFDGALRRAKLRLLQAADSVGVPYMQCDVCKRGPEEGVTIYRMNDKSEPAIWACADHLHYFAGQMDGTPGPIKALADKIEGK